MSLGESIPGPCLSVRKNGEFAQAAVLCTYDKVEQHEQFQPGVCRNPCNGTFMDSMGFQLALFAFIHHENGVSLLSGLV